MTTETIAERLDALQARAETDIRNHVLAGILTDMLAVMRMIAEARAEPADGTGITPEQLEHAIGGAAFLGTLGAMLDRLDRARAQDVERVLDHLFTNRPPAPPSTAHNGAGPSHP